MDLMLPDYEFFGEWVIEVYPDCDDDFYSELPVPRDFTASVLNCKTIHLAWKTPNISEPWAQQYLLTVFNQTFTKSYKLQTTEETITSLQPSSIYNFTLQALEKSGKPFPAKAIITAQIPACDVPVPRDLKASIVNTSTIRVTWLPPKDTSQCRNQYEVIVRNATYQDKVTVTKPEFILPNINPISVYNFTVHATDTNGTPLPASASITVKMTVSDMPVPRNLTASVVDSKNIRVTWLPPVDTSKCGDQYLVIVCNATYRAQVTVTKTEYLLTNPNPSSVYTITVHTTDKKDMPFSASASISVQIRATSVMSPNR
ncbi:unnamed protein product [Dibothriocephalus latus]|uniref:Fibronectin type-III domain-containing protein n=1 Tax=Dibothriocephalus latus TaxID=60516 RepID=A0A3P6QRZ7_DIBLA|nr:unnamed protein product [Dibothriocephalus latus]